MKYLKKFESKIDIIRGKEELIKPTKYGYVEVEIDGVMNYLTPEDVKMRLFIEELIDKGVDKNDIDKLVDLVKEYCWRKERDEHID